MCLVAEMPKLGLQKYFNPKTYKSLNLSKYPSFAITGDAARIGRPAAARQDAKAKREVSCKMLVFG